MNLGAQEGPRYVSTNHRSDIELPRVGLTGQSDFLSSYIFRGHDVYDDRPALQTSAAVTFREAFVTISGWGSFCPVNREEKSIRAADEFGLNFAFRPRVSFFEFGLGHTSFVYFNSDHLERNTAEFFGDVRCHIPMPPRLLGSVFGFVSYDYDQGNGMYARLGTDLVAVLYGALGLTLELPFGGHVGYNNAEFHVERSLSDTDFYAGLLLRARVVFVAVTFHFTLTPEATVNPHDEHEIWFAASVGMRF
jgi:hypothetical protein